MTDAIRSSEDMNRRRWLPGDAYAKMLERREADLHVVALLTALGQCTNERTALALLADTIYRMSLVNAYVTKIATDALAISPMPPMLVRKDP